MYLNKEESIVERLCRPRHGMSCARCCGIYNFKNYSKSGISRVLSKRRELFDSLVNVINFSETTNELEQQIIEYKKQVSCQDILENARNLSATSYLFWCDVNNRPLILSKDKKNCDFVAFTDENKREVGCLLYPNKKKGYLELRQFGHGLGTCQRFNCIGGEMYHASRDVKNNSDKVLKRTMQQFVCNDEYSDIITDWYNFGLFNIIQPYILDKNINPDNLRELFSLVDKRVIEPRDLYLGKQELNDNTIRRIVQENINKKEREKEEKIREKERIKRSNEKLRMKNKKSLSDRFFRWLREE